MTTTKTERDKRVQVRLNQIIYTDLERYARARGLPVATLVANLCGDYVVNQKRLEQQTRLTVTATAKAATDFLERFMEDNNAAELMRQSAEKGELHT